MKYNVFIWLVLIAQAVTAGAQTCPGPTNRTALINLQKGVVVEGTRAGQIPLTDTCGNLRYAQYVEVNLVDIGYTPTTSGNTDNLSEFVTDPGGVLWYIDWQGNATMFGSIGSCDEDWLQISDNSCPETLQDSIYKYNYAAIGARMVWPTAELLINDSTAVGFVLISGKRNSRLGLYDWENQNWSTQDQGGSTTTHYIQDEGLWQVTTASGTPQVPVLVQEQLIINSLDETIIFPLYPNTRVDASTPINFLYTDPDGVVQSGELSGIIPAELEADQGINITGNFINVGASDSIANDLYSIRHFNLPGDAGDVGRLRINSFRDIDDLSGAPVFEIVNQQLGPSGFGAKLRFIEKNGGSIIGGAQFIGTDGGFFIQGTGDLSLNATADIIFPNYPNTRDDGTPVALFGPDGAGNLQVFPIGDIPVGGGIYSPGSGTSPHNSIAAVRNIKFRGLAGDGSNWFSEVKFGTGISWPGADTTLSPGGLAIYTKDGTVPENIAGLTFDPQNNDVQMGASNESTYSKLTADASNLLLEAINISASTSGRVDVNLDDVSSQATNSGGTVSTVLDASGNDVLIGSTITGFEGAKYNADYSSNFVDRSLVDKGYVDAEVAGANGIYGGDGTILAQAAIMSSNQTFEMQFDDTKPALQIDDADGETTIFSKSGDYFATAAQTEVKIEGPGGEVSVGAAEVRVQGTELQVNTFSYLGGVVSPDAVLHLAAGTASAGTAPIKMTAGTNLTTIENGTVEFDGTNYFASANNRRYTIMTAIVASATLNFPSTAAQTSSNLTISATGAADGDVVAVGVPNGSTLSNGCYTAWVSATGTVTVRFTNNSAGPLDPASGTFKVSVMK